MKYLLDVNVLIAIGFVHHQFRSRVMRWVGSRQRPSLFTCSITELGFVRVLAQAAGYGYSVAEAQNLLLRMKQNRQYPLEFLADDADISLLPNWVKAPKQLTDGHLLQLAKTHGMELATLDTGIRGAFLIP